MSNHKSKTDSASKKEASGQVTIPKWARVALCPYCLQPNKDVSKGKNTCKWCELIFEVIKK